MRNTAFSIDEVADWLLAQQAMTPKKLQKLLYYEYVWFLVFFNENDQELDNRLFDGRFEAWPQGPMNVAVHRQYEGYGFDAIPARHSNLAEKTNEDVLDVLQTVYDTYGPYGGDELENATHAEAPWQNARGKLRPLDACHEELQDPDIFDYYVSLYLSN